MTLYLIKKDFLLIRHHILFLLLVAIGIPLFFLSQEISRIDSIIFLLMIIFVELSIYQDISIEEEKYSKATMFLCSLPIERKKVVFARYILAFFVFFVCTILCTLVCWLSGRELLVTLSSVSGALLVLLTILGICIPLQYRYGYGVAKYIYSIICVSSPFVISTFTRFESILNGNSVQGGVIKILIGMAIYLFSYFISCRVFSKTEF